MFRISAIWVAVPVLAVCAAFSAVARAGDVFTFTPAAKYKPEVPTVPSLTGFQVGEKYVDSGIVNRVVTTLAGASDRVRYVRYGETFGGRTLQLLVVSSPENLARWNDIQAGLGKLTDPRRLKDDAERDRLVQSLPVVVWISFNVHGNEASPTEAALAMLYHLAAADDPSVDKLLANAVVVMDPCVNPDGRDRYVNWFRSRVGATPNPDPQADEHDEPWPGGRVNHYYFDLNRDWAFLTQIETRSRIAKYREMMPQVHADLHEMGQNQSYFFFPAATPVHDEFPRATVELAKAFGRGNASAFDRFGWTYYTAEEFDLFYPGYGDSWPSLNGAIGMTYEQAGHSRSGVAVERDDGSILTLKDRAAHHFTAVLATIETSVAHKQELLESYARFYADAMWEGERGPVKDYVLVPGVDRVRMTDLVRLLLDQGIEVKSASAGFRAERCHDFDSDKVESRAFPPGSYVIELAQPRKHLAKALLEPAAAVRENTFYDVSAWSLPLAYGVEAWWTETKVEGALSDVTSKDLAIPTPTKAIASAPRVGYLARWDSFAAPRFLARVQQEGKGGVEVRIGSEPFALDGVSFARGTLFLPAAALDESEHALVRKIAAETGVDLIATDTGLTERGPNLGSGSFNLLAAPSIAIVTGEGTDPGAVGSLRFLLEQRYGFPFTQIPLTQLSRVDLRRYNVLVMPEGFGYFREIPRAKDALTRFVSDGGVLIGMGSAAFALGDDGAKIVGVKSGEADGKAQEPPKPAGWKKLAERRLTSLEDAVPGTMFRLELDPAHPLAYGYDRPLAVLMDSPRAFALEGPGTRVGVFPKQSLLAGFASTENAAKLDGKAFLADVSLGSGHVVLFAGDPTFRGFVRGQVGILMNAMLLLTQPIPTPAPHALR